MKRAAALIVLLTLGGASMTGLLCGFSCTRHEHRQALPAAPDGCHEDAKASDRSIGAGLALCHDDDDRVWTAALVPAAPTDAASAMITSSAPQPLDSTMSTVAARSLLLGSSPSTRHPLPLRI
jgi:hypothetical protein